MNLLKHKIIFFSFLLTMSFLLQACGKEGSVSEEGHSSDSSVLVTPLKSNRVSIQINWDYTQIPLKMEIRELSGSQSMALWTTGSVAKGKTLPFSVLIHESKIQLKPGSKKQFLLVMFNDTKDPVYFFAAPHQAHPVEHSFGFKFKCLCVNHAFTVPPGEYWFRVVELRLAPDFLGDQLTLTHNIIGMTKERMLEFQKGASRNLPIEID